METLEERNRLFIKVTRDTLPQIKDKYPFIYLERGRLEVDDSSVMWIDCDKNIIRLPIATINSLLLGPGTSVTHEAIKVITSTNCSVCWVGEDSLLFFAAGTTPTSNTRNFRSQMEISCDKKKSLEVARRMYSRRFPSADIEGKNLKEMMGMEGYRVKTTYQTMAEKYQVGWKGRSFSPGHFEISDITNQILTSTNAALYGVITSSVYALGYSPHVGFIHSGSPLPFVYDLADLYKEYLSIDLAFKMTLELAGKYDRIKVSSEFRRRVIEMDLMSKIPIDLEFVLNGVKNASNNSE